MKKSNIRNCFNEICEFKDINNLRGLAYTIFKAEHEGISIPHFDEVFGEAIKLLSKLKLASSIEFRLTDQYLNLRDKVEIDYYSESDMGVTPEMAMEGHVYETVVALLQKILDEITSRTVQGVIDITSPNARWSTEKYANLSGYLKPNCEYIVSPKVAAALRCVQHNVEIKDQDQIFYPFYHNKSLVFTDMFATEDFVLELPKNIVVSLSPEITLRVRPRNYMDDAWVVIGTIPLEVSFEPVGLINKIVGIDCAEVFKN